MDRTVRFAILGCGMIAQFHVAALREIEGATLVAVYDHNPELAKKISEAEACKRYDDLDLLLADPVIDVVCICTPSGTHGKLALQALNAGKNILIEKPMALNLQECEQISELAERLGLQVGVVSQTRFDAEIQRVRAAVANGRLGRLVSADLYMKFFRDQAYYDSGTWRGTVAMDGGGALMNQGIHGVDLMQYIIGPLKSIYAVGGTLVRDIEVEDTLNAVVEYQNGAVGVIQAATSTYPGFPRRIEINGEYGYIVLEGEHITAWEVEGELYQPLLAEELRGGHADPRSIDPGGHVRQIENYINALLGEEELLSSDKDGRQTLKVILGAYESLRSKKPCVMDEWP